ncbi:hypothetical protein, partial [Mesorhizobium sp. M2C.T.Ca.TU.002.02.1.1]|uniref:hypothetical protein n=1 Tax=Mesorhizobium sp. M2C.T.Ca.TU.002.02.1.1 TaxID=2496788 RepID=UPI0019D276AC
LYVQKITDVAQRIGSLGSSNPNPGAMVCSGRPPVTSDKARATFCTQFVLQKPLLDDRRDSS